MSVFFGSGAFLLHKHSYLELAFIPEGLCYFREPKLLALHVASDLLIALAYYSIPLMLLYFIRQRRDLPFNWIFLLFGTLSIACGTSHLLEVWMLWQPNYWLLGILKGMTAVASLCGAVVMVPLIRKALALPCSTLLEAANRRLESEIAERKQAEEELAQYRYKLEELVE